MGERTVDDIQVARYDRVFDAYAKGEEFLERDGFANHTRLLAGIRGEAPDSPAIAAFDADLGNTWDQLAAIADTDNDGRVTRDEFRAAAQAITAAMRQAAAAGVASPFDTWIDRLFGVIDADGDGRITQQEYTHWLEALGLAADTDIDAAFAGFDKNDDGHLSLEEFTATYHQFWTEFDAGVPGHRWIGP